MNNWPECIDIWHGTSLGQGEIFFSRTATVQMGHYLAWIIPKTRRFKFVQIKSMGSQMAMP